MRRFLMTAALLALVAMAGRGEARANLVVNGDFEDNTAENTLFNLTNAQFDETVADATAFGTAEEIDLVTGSDFGIPPQSGNWKLGIHTQTNPSFFDAFSLDLSSALVVGQAYDLRFYGAQHEGFSSVIEIGLSSSATDFGTLLFSGSATSTVEWTEFNHAFVATSAATFLTVRTGLDSENYSFVDNFSLTEATTAVPEPSTLALAGLAGLAIAGMARRKPRA